MKSDTYWSTSISPLVHKNLKPFRKKDDGFKTRKRFSFGRLIGLATATKTNIILVVMKRADKLKRFSIEIKIRT